MVFFKKNVHCPTSEANIGHPVLEILVPSDPTQIKRDKKWKLNGKKWTWCADFLCNEYIFDYKNFHIACTTKSKTHIIYIIYQWICHEILMSLHKNQKNLLHMYIHLNITNIWRPWKYPVLMDIPKKEQIQFMRWGQTCLSRGETRGTQKKRYDHPVHDFWINTGLTIDD